MPPLCIIPAIQLDLFTAYTEWLPRPTRDGDRVRLYFRDGADLWDYFHTQPWANTSVRLERASGGQVHPRWDVLIEDDEDRTVRVGRLHVYDPSRLPGWQGPNAYATWGH